MSRKKKSEDKGQEAFSGVLGGKVETTAVINQLTVGCHKDNISFTALSLNGEENEVITDMVKNERDVLMTIGLQMPDKNFPPIQVKGKMKGYTISKTCDAPKIINIQFSSGQVQQITNYIRSEEEIALTFTECEPELNFDGNGKAEGGEQ